jgi:ArsR family transcriptional regulator
MTSPDELSLAFKALSNPNRLQMYLELLQQRQTVVDSGSEKECRCGLTELMTKLNVGAPTVSHHVKELVNARLIRVERQGKYLTCFLNEDMRRQLERFFGQTG